MRTVLARLLVSPTPARRVLLAVWASVPFFLLVLVVHGLAARSPLLAGAVDAPLIRGVQGVVVAACCMNILVAGWLWPRRDEATPCPRLTLLVCLNVGLTYTVITVMSGPFTAPPSLVLVGVLMVGLLLFEPAPIRVVALLCTGTLVVYDVGVLAGWWAYAPALRAALFTDPAAVVWWHAWRTAIFVCGMAVLVGLGWLLFARLMPCTGSSISCRTPIR